mmetsp:Transcript_2257/g.4140  ORF Transcript_2257/g.4140 Transcript_2257/m.4140 type:complete len:517 (+) Transcript_2257:152-1702(+)|eukprot:CAMPEP_0197532540 /NCGR_PEP_ID=MMETSP1318-20131121/40075_1 /TAXON_ID=552666 /ORGANISM="Partenskyella glossopodia, Strain RCC365" /LENGTH=516 /DNA_ID=CAMNT_0043089127 /DNA_START=134 /DNA_END=1684 /DNA_ORIENTATION=+
MRLGFVLFLLLSLCGREGEAAEVDLSVDYRYSVEVNISEPLYLNVSSNSRFVDIVFNYTQAQQQAQITAGGGSPSLYLEGTQVLVENVLTIGEEMTTFTLFPPFATSLGGVDVPECSVASPCRFVLSLGGQGLNLVAKVTQGATLKYNSQIFVNPGTKRSQYYGFVATLWTVPAKIELSPLGTQINNDVDLFVYKAQDLSAKSRVYPNSGDKGKYAGETETAIIKDVWCDASYDVGCLYIVEVYLPSESISTSYSLSLSASKSDDDDDNRFPLHVLWTSAALTTLLLCVMSAIVVFFRMRAALMFQLEAQRNQSQSEAGGTGRAGSGWADPISVPHGELRGVTSSQMKRLKIQRYDPIESSSQYKDDDTKCSICITDYKRGERIVRLPCGHDFHGACVAPWVDAKHRCPLCRQHIATAEVKRSMQAAGVVSVTADRSSVRARDNTNSVSTIEMGTFVARENTGGTTTNNIQSQSTLGSVGSMAGLLRTNTSNHVTIEQRRNPVEVVVEGKVSDTKK